MGLPAPALWPQHATRTVGFDPARTAHPGGQGSLALKRENPDLDGAAGSGEQPGPSGLSGPRCPQASICLESHRSLKELEGAPHFLCFKYFPQIIKSAQRLTWKWV